MLTLDTCMQLGIQWEAKKSADFYRERSRQYASGGFEGVIRDSIDLDNVITKGACFDPQQKRRAKAVNSPKESE